MENKVVQLRVSLKGSRPLIWRRLVVPMKISMRKLRAVLNWTMGWTGGHLHLFEINGQNIGDKQWGELGDWLSDARIRLSDVVARLLAARGKGRKDHRCRS